MNIIIGLLVGLGILYAFFQWALKDIAHEIPGLHSINEKDLK